MADKDPTRSMTAYKGFCQRKVKKIDDFLHDHPDLNSEDIQVLKNLNSALEAQLERMETAWESMLSQLEPETYTALDKVFNEVSEEVAKVLVASTKVISDKATSTQPGITSPTRNANTKIDDTLKPRQELLRSFTLEEANIWFDGFKAYFNHNEKVIEKLPPSVRRQILNNSIEAGLANALQADDEITAETPIIGDNRCLS